jgi:hypothetical protein
MLAKSARHLAYLQNCSHWANGVGRGNTTTRFVEHDGDLKLLVEGEDKDARSVVNEQP